MRGRKALAAPPKTVLQMTMSDDMTVEGIGGGGPAPVAFLTVVAIRPGLSPK